MAESQDITQSLVEARTLIQSGRRAEGDAILQKLLESHPSEPTVPFYLGMSCMSHNEFAAAITWFSRAIQINPKDAVYYCNLGHSLWKIGQYDQAAIALAESLTLNAEYPEALINFANVLFDTNQMEAAEQAVVKSLKIKPYPQALNLFGMILKNTGRHQEAQQAFIQALQMNPSYETAFTNLLHLNMLFPCDPEAHAADFKQLGTAITQSVKPLPLAATRKDPNRKLRIGYLSPDFYLHPIYFFMKPVLQNHDREQFEIICFNESRKSDSATDELKKLSSGWFDTVDLSDQKLAELIREQQIDIAIDLAGLTANHRLRALAHKPAPVQITWLGFPHGTGLSAIDYRITDQAIDPEGHEKFYVEKLIRLPGPFFCYNPPENAPAVVGPPRYKNGYYTFGSFNQLPKLTQPQLSLYASILIHAPESRILFKAAVLDNESAKLRLKSFFTAAGISSERIMLEGSTSLDEYLQAFNRVDVMLDSHPFNSHTNTLHGLYMGVPILTLAGTPAASRMGMTILNELQMSDLVATSPKDFVSKGVHLAQNPQITDAVRRVLRQGLLNSRLCDAEDFMDGFESALREAWKTYCNS